MLRKFFSTLKGSPQQSGSSTSKQINHGNRSDVSASDREARREIQAQRAEGRYKAQLTRGIGGKSRGTTEERAGLLGAGIEQGLASGLESVASACPAADKMVLTVVRSALWTDDGQEDRWQIEVASDGTVADIKTAIAFLYQVPEQAQRLQPTANPGESCYHDSKRAATLLQAPIYLLPRNDFLEDGSDSEHEQPVQDEIMQEMHAAMQENAHTLKAMAESLKGVTYKVNFNCPEGIGGIAIGKSVNLMLDPMAYVGDVLAMVEVEVLGTQTHEATALIHNGQPLLPHVPIHFAGIGNGDTVYLVSAEAGGDKEDIDLDDSFDDAMLTWSHRRPPAGAHDMAPL